MSINVNDKNLGHATAYAYYKAGGGTMTEAEFTEFMADFGTASQTAVEAAQAALASETAAQTAATTATNKASEATTAATTATTKAGEASTSASTATSAKDTAVSASQTATTKATEATTAAATATSAKTDAVAANTAAQSAKTAAQTAQTGAETAAASVQASAAQIQTNADDISELKEDLTDNYIALLSSDFEAGNWSDTGEKISAGRCIRSNRGIKVQNGDRIEYNTVFGNTTFYVQWKLIDGNGNLVEWMGGSGFNGNILYWNNSPVNHTFKHSGTLYLSIRNGPNYGNAANIEPSDFTGSINIYTNYYSRLDLDSALAYINDYNKGISHFPYEKFTIGTNDGVTGNLIIGSTDTNYLRVGSDFIFDIKKDTIASIKSGFRFGFMKFDSNDVFISGSDSGWIYDSVIIPAGSRIRIGISRYPESSGDQKLTTEDIKTFVSALELTTDIGERVSTLEKEVIVNYSYFAPQNFISMDKWGYNIENTGIMATYPSSITVGTATSFQGLGVFGGVIFQCYSDDAIVLIDMSTKSIIAELAIDCGHGNNINFSNEYYDANDEFPLAYVQYSSGGDNNIVKVIRITRSGCTTIRTIKIPVSISSYYAECVLDPVNNVLYMIGYKQYSYSNPSNNYLIVSSFDLNNTTDNGDNTVTPLKIGDFNLPFYTTSQGSVFYNNCILFLSSHWENTETKLLVIDPVAKGIRSILTEFPASIKGEETEGIAIVDNGNKYAILLKTNTNTNYYKVVF